MSAQLQNQLRLINEWPRTVPEARPRSLRFRPAADSLRVEVVRDRERLRELVPAWEALAAAAVEQNVFYEPFMVLPALQHLGAQQPFQFVLVYGTDRTQPSGHDILCGFFPLVRRAASGKFPMANLELWSYIHCFLCTPLVHRDCANQVIETFLDWLQAESGSKLIAFRRIGADGPFYQALVAHLHHRDLPAWVSRNYVRAVMRRGEDAEDYLEHAISSGRMKEYRRQERRLAEAGTLGYRALTDSADLESWLDGFLHIEGCGWKGRNSSALRNSDQYCAFFQEVVRAAFAKNRLQMLAMVLNGEVIAQKCNFISEPGAFCFKIGFDERFHRYSPGVLLEIENIRRFHEDRRLEWMDSCAEPDHPMIDHIWTGRRTIQSLMVGLGQRSSDFMLALAPLLQWLKRGGPAGKNHDNGRRKSADRNK